MISNSIICTLGGKNSQHTKKKVRMKLLVDDEGQLLATAGGKTLPVGSSYPHLSGIAFKCKQREK